MDYVFNRASPFGKFPQASGNPLPPLPNEENAPPLLITQGEEWTPLSPPPEWHATGRPAHGYRSDGADDHGGRPHAPFTLHLDESPLSSPSHPHPGGKPFHRHHDHDDHWHDHWTPPPAQDGGDTPQATKELGDPRWPRPAMVNPIEINLDDFPGKTFWSFTNNPDVIFYGESGIRTESKLHVDGAHNVMVLGGDYRPANQATATLYFQNITGNVYIDGVHIDNGNAAAFGNDGIQMAGTPGFSPNLYVQNSRIENIDGTVGGRHGDGIQTSGTFGNIYIFNVAITTGYQGIFISPQANPVQPHYAYLENVDVRYTNPASSEVTYLYWFLDGTNQPAYPIDLKNVYAGPKNAGVDQPAERYSVWPASHLDASIAAIRDGNTVVWPTAPYHGQITLGPAPVDFAPLAQIGLNYDPDNPGPLIPPAEVAPIARADTYTTTGTLTITTRAAGVLGNDVDGNNHAMSVVGMSGSTDQEPPVFDGTTARGGTVKMAVDGTFSYTPPPGYTGKDSFAYIVRDTEGQIDVGEVVLNVGTPPPQTNLAPIVVNKTVSTPVGTAVALGIAPPVDPNGDVMKVTLTGLPTNGVVQLQDGTPVHANQILSVGQLAGLKFVPNANASTTPSNLFYRVEDFHGGSAQGDVALSVVSASNQAPVITTNDGAALVLSIAENQTAGSLVVDVNATDPNVGATLTWSIIGGNAQNLFAINSATGVLSWASSPDYEALLALGATSQVLTIQVSDGQLTDSMQVTVNVTDVNEAPGGSAPVITTNDGAALVLSIAENQTAGSLVVDVNATDANPGDTLTWSITGGNAQNLFAINSATGVLSWASSPDYEALLALGATSQVLTIQVSDGQLTDSMQVTVNVTDVNEAPVGSAPVITTNGGVPLVLAVAENQTAGSLVVDVNATDANPGDTMTWSITGGNAQNLFAINAATGVLSWASSPDYEALLALGATSQVLTIQVSDGQLTDSMQVTVNVTNVNEAPVASSPITLAASAEDMLRTITAAELLAGAVDPDGNPLSILNLTASSGALVANPGGTWTFTPALNDDTAVTFTYTVSDGVLGTVRTATLDLTPVNDMVGTNAGQTMNGGNLADQIDGNGGSDSLFGNGGNDVLVGGTGNDRVNGGSGNDVLVATLEVGSDGNDTYNGGSGIDTYDLSRTTANANVNLANGQSSSAQTGIDGLTGVENVIGSQGNDTITGNSSNNRLEGGLGNDILAGGGGVDVLSGGAGADTFVFSGNPQSTIGLNAGARDQIIDFQVGVDKINLSAIDANTATGTNNAFVFVGLTPVTPNAAGQVGYRFETDANGVAHTIVEGTVNTTTGIDFRLDLIGIHDLTQNDLIL